MNRRHQHLRHKGAKMPANCKLVSRGSRWGNPFKVGDIMRESVGDWGSGQHPMPLWHAHFDHLANDLLPQPNPSAEAYRITRLHLATTHAVALFRALAEHFRAVDPAGFETWIAPLRGHDLACSCPLDQTCHADVLLELANEVPDAAERGAG
jgi:Domain of unknown function (DUF4326)